MKLIIILIMLAACAGFFIYSNKPKNKAGNKKKNVQDFMNVKNIKNGFIYTKDGYIIGFLQISGQKTDLLSNREKVASNKQITAEMSTISSSWQILCVPRPEDNTALVQQYQDMLENANPIRKKLLREAIRYQNEQLLSGENMERQFYLKIWNTEHDGAEQELAEKRRQFIRCFDMSGYSCEEVNREEAIQLCNLVHNPAAVLYEPDDIQTYLPRMIS